jgi:hypothetical protein
MSMLMQRQGGLEQRTSKRFVWLSFWTLSKPTLHLRQLERMLLHRIAR